MPVCKSVSVCLKVISEKRLNSLLPNLIPMMTLEHPGLGLIVGPEGRLRSHRSDTECHLPA